MHASHPQWHGKINISHHSILAGEKFLFENEVTQVQILQHICKLPDTRLVLILRGYKVLSINNTCFGLQTV